MYCFRGWRWSRICEVEWSWVTTVWCCSSWPLSTLAHTPVKQTISWPRQCQTWWIWISNVSRCLQRKLCSQMHEPYLLWTKNGNLTIVSFVPGWCGEENVFYRKRLECQPTLIHLFSLILLRGLQECFQETYSVTLLSSANNIINRKTPCTFLYKSTLYYSTVSTS